MLVSQIITTKYLESLISADINNYNFPKVLKAGAEYYYRYKCNLILHIKHKWIPFKSKEFKITYNLDIKFMYAPTLTINRIINSILRVYIDITSLNGLKEVTINGITTDKQLNLSRYKVTKTELIFDKIELDEIKDPN